MKFVHTATPIDTIIYMQYACRRPGRPGAAEPAEPRQGRKTATVRECLWVPPVACPDIFIRSPEGHRDDVSGTAVILCGEVEEQTIRYS